jgi:hypothetical protein
MQGRSLLAGQGLRAAPEADLTAEDEQILTDRLSGLGYI